MAENKSNGGNIHITLAKTPEEQEKDLRDWMDAVRHDGEVLKEYERLQKGYKIGHEEFLVKCPYCKQRISVSIPHVQPPKPSYIEELILKSINSIFKNIQKEYIPIFLGLILIIIMALFPPWNFVTDAERIHTHRNAGYSNLFSPPTVENSSWGSRLNQNLWSSRIDKERLYVQFIIVIALSAGGYIVLKPKRKNE